jgi:hypothetical protein
MKRCVRCGIDRPIERFEPKRRTCRDCVNAAARAKGRRTYSAEGHRRWTYGMDQSEFDWLLHSQGGTCPVCRRELVKPVVDHDHRTGAIRGLLCGPCNRGIGHFLDDPGRCVRAALYLR